MTYLKMLVLIAYRMFIVQIKFTDILHIKILQKLQKEK